MKVYILDNKGRTALGESVNRHSLLDERERNIINHSRILGFIVLLLLIIVGGVCVADNPSSLTAYIQGGEGSIANGINRTNVITAKDVVPYFYLTKGEAKF
jgi:hypothetical protein